MFLDNTKVSDELTIIQPSISINTTKLPFNWRRKTCECVFSYTHTCCFCS